MKYMMLVCADESVELSPEEGARMGPATEAWVEEMERRGSGCRATGCGR